MTPDMTSYPRKNVAVLG